MIFSRKQRLTTLKDWSDTNSCFLNGPNFPSVVSQAIPLAEFPTIPCGSRTGGGTYSGIRAASMWKRPPFLGTSGFGPMLDASEYHLYVSGWPWNEPGTRCFSALVPFHTPWLSQ